MEKDKDRLGDRLRRVADLLERGGGLSRLERDWAEKVLMEAYDQLGRTDTFASTHLPTASVTEEKPSPPVQKAPVKSVEEQAPPPPPTMNTPGEVSDEAPPPQPATSETQPSSSSAAGLPFEETKTLADRLRKDQLKSLSKAIPLHHKMMFVQRLFGDDERAYRKAIQFLDSCRMLAEARTYMEHEVAPHYGWTTDEEAYQVLLSYLRERLH